MQLTTHIKKDSDLSLPRGSIMKFVEKLKDLDPAALKFEEKDKLLSLVFDAAMEIVDEYPEEAKKLCYYQINRERKIARFIGDVNSSLAVENIEACLDYHAKAYFNKDRLDFFSDIGYCMYYIGKVLRQNKNVVDNEVVLAPLFFALEIRKAVEAEEYTHRRAVDVSACYNSIAYTYERMGDFDKALAYYELDKKQCEKRLEAAKVYGEIMESLRSLSYCYEDMADLLEKQGNKEKAEEYLSLSREFMGRTM